MSALDVTVSRLAAEDLPSAAAVLDAAFGRSGMIAGLQRAFSLQAEHWLCARRDGRIIGVVGGHAYGHIASIGMMGVDPAAQRQGLAERLMRALIAHLTDRGCSLLFLDASAAGQHLYPRLGFAAEGETLRMMRQSARHAAGQGLSSAGTRRGSGEVEIRPLAARDVDEVIAFDAPLFGADRGAVIRECRGGQPARAFIARGAGERVLGYLFADGGHIGPWMAATPAAAEGLLGAALGLPYDRPPVLTAPAENADAMALLARQGFTVTERLLHMRRGGTADPRQVRFLYAQTSLTLG